MIDNPLKTSLDDLVALLLQGQAPFGDAEFIAASTFYRQNRPGGAIARAQVNLSACLYLSVKGERITEPRIRELGGWGQRNAMLTDMASFNRGHRPTTSGTTGKSMLALGAPAADVLQIAVSQGLEAAQKAIEASMQERFERRVEEIEVLADQRVLAAERNAMAATELKEAAQAESRLLEQKFDQAVTGRTELTNRAVAAESRAEGLAAQVAAITASLTQANERLMAAEQGSRALQAQLDELQERREAERRDHMLALDRARHGNDQLLATQQGEISRLAALLERSQESGESHAQAARRAEALMAGSQAELAAAVAKIGDLQSQVEVLGVKLEEAVKAAGSGEAIVGALQVLRMDVASIASTTQQSGQDMATRLQALDATLQKVVESKRDK
jgi:chromosome segregation ATPase